MYAGYLEEGDTCTSCKAGKMMFPKAENCSCHISPPCYSCTSVKLTCEACGWEDDAPEEKYITVAPDLVMLQYKPKPLDTTKIDYRIKMHSACSMIVEGVYPPGTTPEEVRKLVNGTFGGVFQQFGNGTFKFIKYTD